MRKGTIVLVPFPFTDLSGSKVRPCLVLYAQKNGEDCLVSFISSVLPSRKGSFQVKIKLSTANGLKRDSVLTLDKLATLQKKIILGELGTLEPILMKMVNTNLRKMLDLA